MINGELIVDNFAGGGGASTGIEEATGFSVDIAINHDPKAIAMHKVNHPNTKHYCEDVWQVDPVQACNGHPVGLAWFSPDCKHFSKAKGGKPKDKNIRGLAWVACRWAGLVRPRVIMLENVEEFKTWGPLNRGHHPIKAKQVVNGIYEQIGRIDSCNAVLKVMDNAEVSLLQEDGNLVDTSSALTVEQRADVLYNMRCMIKGNIDEAAAALEAVQNAGKKPVEVEEPEADTAAGEDEAAVQTVKKNNQPPERKSRMDKGTVLQLLKDGYSIQDIADRYGYKTTKTVDNFCKANKINTKLYERSDRQLTDADIPQIRALYTDGPFNLTQTAGELGVSKKQLRAFVEEKHLVKPVAD